MGPYTVIYWYAVVLCFLIAFTAGCEKKVRYTYICDGEGYARTFIQSVYDQKPVPKPGEVCRTME